MGKEVNLLAALPKPKRNICARATAKTPEIVAKSREHGFEYFDGPREYGYGGYRYDGRWIPVAQDIVRHFNLKPGDRILDIGCAKGFLVKDLLKACPGLEAFGLDVSGYALTHCEPEAVGRLHRLDLANPKMFPFPFPDKSFAAVIAINTLHDLERPDLIRALREMQRLAPGRGFVQVDSYRTPDQKRVFEEWVLTAKFHDYPDGWIRLFNEAGYSGDYYWTIVE